MKEVLTRSISGLVYMALIVLPVYFAIPWLYLLVFSTLIVLGMREYANLVGLNRTRPIRTIVDGLFAAYFFVAAYLYLSGSSDADIFLPTIFFILYTLVRSLYSDRLKAGSDSGRTFMGQLYVAGSLSFGHLLLLTLDSATVDFAFPLVSVNPLYFISIFLLIWANDTGAFVAGSLFGKHTLFKVISPKKTWEGFAGGLLASIVAGLLIGHFTANPLPLHIWTLLALVVSATATWGDLYESNLKRNAGVKDSGKIMPGHGGVLDRLDSAFFAFPAAYVLLRVAMSYYNPIYF